MDSNFIVYKASAGSGKTYTLAVEYIKQLLLGVDRCAHRHILAVTFTKEATGEMKDRIIAELYGLAAGLDESRKFAEDVQKALQENGCKLSFEEICRKAKVVLCEILHDYSRFQVGTIDSFFQKVLRNLARELGKGSKFNLELNTVRVLDDAVKAMIEKSNDDIELLEWISRYVEDKIEQGKSWRVDKELKSFGMNIFNEYFQEHERAMRLQLDENPKLIAEMTEKHLKLKDNFEKRMMGFANLFFAKNPDENDFYYKKSGVPGYFKKLKNGDYSDPNSYVCKILNGEQGKSGDIEFLTLLQEAEECRSNGIRSYISSVLLLQNIFQLGLLRDISEEMEAQNKENNRFMLSQTALFLNQMMGDSDASFVFEKIGSTIHHIMIDEFQDTSRLQWRNFRVLLEEVIANGNFSLLVGDVKQSIYRWRNGDWNILNNLEEEMPQVSVKNLDKNYRSQRRVVDFNNAFFTASAESLSQYLEAEFDGAADNPFPTAYKIENVKQTPIAKDEKGFVSIDFLDDDKEADVSYDEAVMWRLVEQLQELQAAGVKANDICILTRTNGKIRDIANYLSLQKDDQPALYAGGYLSIISDDAFLLGASPALKIIIEALRLVLDWENSLPRTQLLLMWQEFVADNARQHLDTHRLLAEGNDIDHLLPDGFKHADFAQLQLMPLYDLVLHIYRLFILPIIGKNDLGRNDHTLLDQSAYVYSFLDNLTSYLESNPSDIKVFLGYWDDELCMKSIPKKSDLQGIQAMTIHKSKGLQFHTVIVPFCDWDMTKMSTAYQRSLVWCEKHEVPFDLEILPVEYSSKMKQSLFSKEFAEETVQLLMDNLNVLYVAFTRAERNLLILSKKTKKHGAVKPVSELVLSFVQTDWQEYFDGEMMQMCFGTIEPSVSIQHKKVENILKNNGEKTDVQVVFLTQQTNTPEFKQSNKSIEFISGKENWQNSEYIQEGNVLHAIFEKINSVADIEKAVQQLVFDGIIPADKTNYYTGKIKTAIAKSGVEDWFSGRYRLFNECTILQKSSTGKVFSRRPDRVMMTDSEVIVVDYKTGNTEGSYRNQVKQYIDLLQNMGYKNITGYLWYVDRNDVVTI